MSAPSSSPCPNRLTIRASVVDRTLTRWWQHLLHNQRALLIKGAPYRYGIYLQTTAFELVIGGVTVP